MVNLTQSGFFGDLQKLSHVTFPTHNFHASNKTEWGKCVKFMKKGAHVVRTISSLENCNTFLGNVRRPRRNGSKLRIFHKIYNFKCAHVIIIIIVISRRFPKLTQQNTGCGFKVDCGNYAKPFSICHLSALAEISMRLCLSAFLKE